MRATRQSVQRPEVLAVIPARGGSKGVPGKNLARVGSVPLVARAVRVCRAAPQPTAVAVSTDDRRIAAVARAEGAWVVERPAALADDAATSEAALRHALDVYQEHTERTVHVLLLVQCTSPFLAPADVSGVAAAVLDGADTALTVAPFHGFLWRGGPDGTQTATGVNHTASHRPRRQDRPEDLLETGAAYAMDAAGFRAVGHRFFGRTVPVRTEPARVLEIDEPHDLERARLLAPLLEVDAATEPRRDVPAPLSPTPALQSPSASPQLATTPATADHPTDTPEAPPTGAKPAPQAAS